jgi:hypothetical protein
MTDSQGVEFAVGNWVTISHPTGVFPPEWGMVIGVAETFILVQIKSGIRDGTFVVQYENGPYYEIPEQPFL